MPVYVAGVRVRGEPCPRSGHIESSPGRHARLRSPVRNARERQVAGATDQSPVMPLLGSLIDVYSIVVLVAVVLSWLQLDRRNPVATIVYGLTESVLRLIRSAAADGRLGFLADGAVDFAAAGERFSVLTGASGAGRLRFRGTRVLGVIKPRHYGATASDPAKLGSLLAK